jgi:hypothetical protein
MFIQLKHHHCTIHLLVYNYVVDCSNHINIRISFIRNSATVTGQVRAALRLLELSHVSLGRDTACPH